MRDSGGPDLIHTHTARSAAIARLACWGRRARPRLVVHFHGTVSHRALRPKNRMLERLLKSRVDLVLAPTMHAAMRGAHIHAFRGLPVRVVPNGVDLSRLERPALSPAECRRRWGIPEAARVVLLLGRWTWVKGHDVLLDAVPTVLASPEDVRFVFVGPEDGGPYRSWLVRRIQTTALRRFVVVAGREADPVSSLAAADVVAMPSRDETFGLVAVEAMASGRPLVATRVGGLPEVCGDRSGVRWVAAADPDDLGRGIRAALEEPDAERRERADALRRRADRFALPRYLERLQAAYADVLGRPDLLPAGWRPEEAGAVEWERPARSREPAVAATA
jgi:glycosyltransferase involved in cell wall biosynthesis